MKKALITGITGQDGSYLAELLLSKNYEVYGMLRRNSQGINPRLNNFINKINIIYGDLTDPASLVLLINKIQPDEVYNLGAQSFVGLSWSSPQHTTEVTGQGAANLLNIIRQIKPDAKFYQASSSEMFGLVKETPQTETTPFNPQSPYGVAKTFAHHYTIMMNRSYNLFAVSGILFNHECISENTPLIIRKKGIISIKRAKDIRKPKQKGKNLQQWTLKDTEIWDGDDFIPLKLLTATKRKKNDTDFQCKIVNTRNGIVEVTNHHNMLNEKHEKIKTKNVKINSKLLHKKFPSQKEKCKLSKEEARFLGMMAADGWIGKDGNANFMNNNKELIAKFEGIWMNVGLGTISYATYKTEYGFSIRARLNGGKDYLKYIQNQLYTEDGFKKVPDRILNTSKGIQLSFLEGYNDCDGLKSNPCKYTFKNFKTNSILLAQGLLFLIKQTTNQEFNITFEQDKKYYGYYSINFLSQVDNISKEEQVKNMLKKGFSQKEIFRTTGISRGFIRKIHKGEHAVIPHHKSKPKNEVKKIISHKSQPEWVFDIETISGKFMAGIGTITISNSPRRGIEFVTRKITSGIANIIHKKQEKISLGNLDAERDWGYAPDYVEAMWLMLQQDSAKEENSTYVISTGKKYTVRQFVEMAFQAVGIEITWRGSGSDEKGYDSSGKLLVDIDKKYFRPAEVELLVGNSSKANEKLGWTPKTDIKEMIKKMIEHDLLISEKNLHPCTPEKNPFLY